MLVSNDPLEHLDPLQLITLTQLSRLAHRSPDALKRDINEGRLRSVRLGRSIRIPMVEAERYLTKGTGE